MIFHSSWKTYNLEPQLTDPPGAPGKPTITDYDKDRAEIKWTSPKSDGGSPIQKYVIEKKEKGKDWEKVFDNYLHKNIKFHVFIIFIISLFETNLFHLGWYGATRRNIGRGTQLGRRQGV